MINKVILTDIDETVVEYSAGIHAFTASVGFHPLHSVRDKWMMDECYGITQSQCNAIIQSYWASEAFGKIQPERCAQIVIPRLRATGWAFVAITAAAPSTTKKREDNLEEAFGFRWDAVHCVGDLGKGFWLDAYRPAVWVEDNLEHAIRGASAGHQTYLLDRGYNRTARTDIRRVSDWYEIEELITERP